MTGNAVAGCPRVDPTRGVIRLRANAGSSIYHSLQVSYDRRFSNGFTAGAPFTLSAFTPRFSATFYSSPPRGTASLDEYLNLPAARRPSRDYHAPTPPPA